MKNLIFKFIMLLFMVLPVANCFSQLTTDYTKLIINQNRPLQPIDIVTDSNYEMYVLGVNGVDSILVHKYAADGTLIWKKQFFGSNGTIALKNDVLAVEVTEVTGLIVLNTVLRRLDKTTGNTLGSMIYYDTFIDNINADHKKYEQLIIGNTGIYLGCNVKVVTNGINRYDYKLVKYAFSGYNSWQRTYVHGYDFGLVMGTAIDATENIYLTGYVHNGENGANLHYATLTMKYSGSTGSQLWVNNYLNASGNMIQIDGSGNPIICGTEYIPFSGSKGYIKKFNSSGSVQWVKYITPRISSDDASVLEIETDQNNNIYSRSTSKNSGLYRPVISKFSSDGTALWSSTYFPSISPDSTDNLGDNIALGKNGSVYLTGTSNRNAYITKFDGSGNFIWDYFYETGSQLYTNGVRINIKTNPISGDTKIFYAGILKSPTTNTMIFLSRYNESFFTIKPTGKLSYPEIPGKFSLSQNYPNPFNPETKIKFDIPDKSQNVKLSVFDVSGKEIELLVNEQMKPGRYEINWNASGYPSGVYFYTIKTDNFTDTKKMLLVK